MRGAILGAICCLASQSAAAGTVPVRSGEHEGFTRLVLQLPADAAWFFDRTGSGYLLTTDDPKIAYDLSKTFDYITRDRIGAIKAAGGPGGLAMTLACDCHAVATGNPVGLLVIDVSDGPGAGAPLPEVLRGTDPAPGLPDFWFYRLGPAASEGGGEPGRAVAAGSGETDHARLDAAARLLEWQVSRAMGQGLVEPAAKTPAAQLIPPKPGRADGPDMPATAELGLAAQTAQDHAAAPAPQPEPEASCPDPEDFAARGWADDRDFAVQMAEARAGLLGEFDRPVDENIVKAARLYLHFGLGVEAADLVRGLGLGPEADHHVAALAEIVEGNVRPGNPLLAMDCGGDALLWRVLAAPDTLAPADTGPVLASFSALPAPLRTVLAPRLIDILLAHGDTEAARAIRDAMLRGAADTGDAALVDLGIALADPDARPDPVGLVNRLSRQGENMPQSLILVIDAYRRQGRPVPVEITELAETLAFELRGAGQGTELRQSLALALASQGRFVEAFARFDDQTGEGAPAIPPDLFGELVGKADDGQFLRLIFERMAEARAVKNAAQWNVIGTRLATLGFPAEASGFLRRPAVTEADHILAARIAAADGRVDEALDGLRGLTSPEAEALRQSLHPPVQPGVGSPDASGASDPRAPEGGPGAAAQDATRPDPGLLGATRDLLERSKADRKSIETLLKAASRP